jgi:hypothetical protein
MRLGPLIGVRILGSVVRDLEVAREVRRYLPAFCLEEALQARERGDATCPLCKRLVEVDQGASLLVTTIGPQYRIALVHRRCAASQIVDIAAPRGRLRQAPPRAVFMWENQTDFDQWDGHEEGGDEVGSLRLFGFQTADGPVESLQPTQADYMSLAHRRDGLDLRLGEVIDRRFPEAQPRGWREQAAREGRVLAIYGTALGLGRFDPARLRERMAAGRVVSALLPYRDDQGCLGPRLAATTRLRRRRPA